MKHGLDEVVLSIPYFAPLKFLAKLNPFRLLREENLSEGTRIRLALEELGPIFVKFGQTLSTRGDLFPPEIIKELSKLQDNVPPFPGEKAKEIIEAELEDKVENLFSNFNITPKASASIAQVHEVILKDSDKKAVVKVIRPGIANTISQDMALIKSFCRIVDKYWSEAKRFHLNEVVEEFEKVIHDELDLMREAANASQLRRNFKDSDLIYIPEIYWDYVSDNVMVMEYVEGIPVADKATLLAENINLKALAERGVEIFFTQVFRDSFFHADMHPGNIFVNPDKKNDPQYIAIDFGIVGTLSSEDQYYLASNMLAFFKRDYRKVAQLHIQSNWVASHTRVDEFESAIRTVCEPIFERPLHEISFGKTLMRLFQIGRRFQMEIQPQLLLLQKTLLHIEGLGRQLYPELNLWASAKPFFEKWMSNQVGPKAALLKMYDKQTEWSRQMPEIPELIYSTLKKLDNRQKITKKENDSVSKWRYIFTGIGLAFTVLTILLLVWKQAIFNLHLNYAMTASILALVSFLVSNIIKK